LKANGYTKPGNWNILDYHKIEQSSRLSGYEVTLPVWREGPKKIRPFSAWTTTHSLGWYQAYNEVKHDRFSHFEKAKLANAIEAIASVLVILFSQFHVHAFDAYHRVEMYSEDNCKISHVNCVFEIETPSGWSDADKYDFDWVTTKAHPSPVRRFTF
jgi:hypothetical protein